MYFIVVHHYVVNSGLINQMKDYGVFTRNLVYAIAGGWGKVAINCFVLITGYFMCESNISVKKFIKLFTEVIFYDITIFIIFWMSGYESFQLKSFAKCIFPFYSFNKEFASCYLVFYLLIPYLNILIKQMTQNKFISLMSIILMTYSVIPSIPKTSIMFNYVSWFCIIYLLGAFIRMYGNNIRFLSIHIGVKCTLCFILSIIGIITGTYFSNKENARYWYFVADSNKLLALAPALFAFIWFKNLKIKYNKLINLVASSTFGVLMIHANGDTMRRWLWKDLLHNEQMYLSNYFIIHMIVSTVCIFVICTLIDLIRIQFLEIPFMKWISSMMSREDC